MKQRIWIILLLVVCVGLVSFGAYKLCSSPRQREEMSAGKVGGAEKSADEPSVKNGGGHVAGLDKVVLPASVGGEEYEYEGFRLSFNKRNRTPNWVAWELLGEETDGAAARVNNFWQDPGVDGCPTTNDYKNSGYDRGHMCPAADQKWSDKAMNDCFVMANMCPQDHALNAGAWNTLEGRERSWAKRDSAIVIVAGPIYAPDDRKTIGGGVRVPSSFFKVILAPYVAEPRAIAFVYPNMSAPGNMQNYVVTVDEVEKLTGFDFFSALPDDIEKVVESKSSFREWNKR